MEAILKASTCLCYSFEDSLCLCYSFARPVPNFVPTQVMPRSVDAPDYPIRRGLSFKMRIANPVFQVIFESRFAVAYLDVPHVAQPRKDARFVITISSSI